MKIAMIIPSLHGGGAERVAVNLAEGLLEQGHAMAILTMSNPDSDFYPLDSRIKRIQIYATPEKTLKSGRLRNKYRQLTGIRRAVQEVHPDVVISFLHTINEAVLISLFGTQVPVVVTEHNWPGNKKSGSLWSLLRFILYPGAAFVVSVSRGIDNYFFWIRSAKRRVIPCAVSYTVKDSGSTCKEKRVIAVGRLVAQKGFDILLRAFAGIAAEHDSWNLMILGEGPERRNLESLVEKLQLTGRVAMPGWQQDPHVLVMESSIFVLSSRFEGFPNALLEAMACRTAVISFDCPTGPNEMIVHGENGLLVEAEDDQKLAEAMSLLIRDQTLRNRLAENAGKIATTFSKECITEMWTKVLHEVVDKHKIVAGI